jgi:hypothetical protein
MTKTELIINLIKFRMSRAGQAAGFSEADAEEQAEAVVSEQGLRGWFGGSKAVGTPDGAIVTNVETYVCLLNVRGCLNGNVSEATLVRVNNEAIISIEQHRRKRWPGSSNHPFDLSDYNFYRTQVEVMAQFGIEPEQMGLDRETVGLMTNMALDYFIRTKTA